MTQKEINIESKSICNDIMDKVFDITNEIGWSDIEKEMELRIATLITTACQADSIAFGNYICNEGIDPHGSLNDTWAKSDGNISTSDLYALYLIDKSKNEGI